MNTMADEVKVNASDTSGSADGSGKTGETVPKEVYQELFSKFGAQGEEVGKLREVFKLFEPILEKFDESPEIVEAIRSGKLTGDMAKAILENKVTVGEAIAAANATAEVKAEMGEKAFKEADPELIAKKVMESIDQKLDAKLGSVNEKMEKLTSKSEEKDIENFIAAHPDIHQDEELNKALEEYMDKNGDAVPFDQAYFNVKGKLLTEREAKKAADKVAEESKDATPGAANSARTAGEKKQDVSDYVRVDMNTNSFT